MMHAVNAPRFAALIAVVLGCGCSSPSATKVVTCERLIEHLATTGDQEAFDLPDSISDCQEKTTASQRACMLKTKSAWHARSCLQHENPTIAHALLDRFVEAIRMVSNGSGQELIAPSIAALRADLAQSSGADFAKRFGELLDVTEMLVGPAETFDRDRVALFVNRVSKTDLPAMPTVADVGPALAEEVLRLYMELDKVSDRAQAVKRYLPELGAPK